MLQQIEAFRRLELPSGDVIAHHDMRLKATSYEARPLWLTFTFAGIVWLPCWWITARMLDGWYRHRMERATQRENAALDALGVAP